MAKITDLTFEDLNSAAVADLAYGNAIFTFSGGDIVLSTSALTGDTFSATSDFGFIEFFHKLRDLCTKAQAAVNEATATTPDEELTTFPSIVYSPPNSEGRLTAQHAQVVELSVNTSVVYGTNS